MSTTIESLELQIQSNSSSATNGIDALSASLSKLKNAIKGGVGLTSVANQLCNINAALQSINPSANEKLSKLSDSLSKLSGLGSIKISSSIGNQLKNISSAASALNTTNFDGLSKLGNTLHSFSNLGKINLSTFTNNLPKLAQVMNSLNVRKLEAKMRGLNNALAPVVTSLNLLNTSFRGLPANMMSLISVTNASTVANNKNAFSWANIAAKATVAYFIMKRAAHTVASWITESNSYIENLNLFTASMGEYAQEAQKYAEQVGEIMGIDPSEWMRNQGVFNTIITGFGVASDRAYTMSKNLTQLGYDLSSLFNISFEDAMQKLQSGISGELEPLRRLGYDLSVARLQQEAWNLGIDKSVNKMTQAEKSQLRYYAIMTQVTVAQGDMARTLNAPANQIRILKAQVKQCARALGNIFIPALNAVLPYAIALAKVIRQVASAIASLFRFKLPKVDYSGISAGATAVGDLADNADNAAGGLGKAGKAAKKLKNHLLDIDELNVLSKDPTNGAGGGAGGVGGIGGDLGIELPKYDFLKNVVASEVDEIIQKMKEWLGLTDEINSWGDFFHTRLGRILTTVGAIGLGLAAWKIGKGVLSALQYINALKGAGLGSPLNIVVGISLLVTGIALEWAGIIDAIKYELNSMNFGQIVKGGLLTVGSGAFLGKGIAAWIAKVFSGSAVATALETAATNLGLGSVSAAGAAIGAGVAAIIAGLPMYFVGIWDSIKNGLNWLNGVLIPTGSTMTVAGIGAIIGACGGPLTAGIGALIGLAVGLVTDGIIAITQHWEEIKSITVTAWNNIVSSTSTIISNLPQIVSDTFDTVIQVVKGFPQKLQTGLSAVGKFLDSVLSKVKKFFTDLKTNIKDWFDKLWQPIKDFDWRNLGHTVGVAAGKFLSTMFKLITQTVPSKIDELKTAIVEALTKILFSIADFILKLPGRLLSIYKSVKTGIRDIGVQIVNGIVEGLATFAKAVPDFVSGFFIGLVDGIKEAFGIHSPSVVMQKIGVNIVGGLINGIKSFTNMAGLVKDWAGSVVEWFTAGKDGRGIVENFKETANKVVGGFREKIGTTYTSVRSNITTWASSVKSWFTENKYGGANFTTFSGYANNVLEGFRTKIRDTYMNGKSSITTWANGVKDWFTNSSYGGANGVTFSTYANNVLEGFRTKIRDSYTSVKSNIVTWASGVKSWFSEIASNSAFAGFATNVIDGFKSRIGSYYTAAKSNMNTFGSQVKSWFGEYASYNSFYNVASDVVNGFKNGIGKLYSTCKRTISSWGSSIINWFKDKLDVHSPSRIFRDIGMFTVEGFNSGITGNRKSTQGIMSKWFDSFMVDVPRLAFTVDTSAIDSFSPRATAYDMQAQVQSNYNSTVMTDDSTMREVMKEAMLEALNTSNMAVDMKRQADKEEQTIVQVGNRTVTDAVVTQQKANGYTFTK